MFESASKIFKGTPFDKVTKPLESSTEKGQEVAKEGANQSLLDEEERKKKLQAAEEKYNNRAAPQITPDQVERVDRNQVREVNATPIQAGTMQAATIDQTQANQVRERQMGLINQLEAQAQGKGPSIAQQQLQQGMEANLAASLAARAGTQGSGASLARRDIAQQQVNQGQALAAQSGIQRLQEQGQAQQLLGQTAGQTRGQDLEVATSQAGFEQQASVKNLDTKTQVDMANMEADLKSQLANQGVDLDVLKTNAAAGNAASLANLEAKLRQAGMNDDMIKAYMSDLTTQRGQDLNFKADSQRTSSNEYIAKSDAQAKQEAGFLGAISTFAGGMATKSDINAKKNITPAPGPGQRQAFATALQNGAKPGQTQAQPVPAPASRMQPAQRFAPQAQAPNATQNQATFRGDNAKDMGLYGNSARASTNDLDAVRGAGGGNMAQLEQDRKTAQAYANAVKSDREDKKDIDVNDKGRLHDFLQKLSVYDYDYKNPEDGMGRQTSVMAQDLEKSDIGKKAIVEADDGKRVDYIKILPEMLAANVDAHKRITELEMALKAKKGKK